MEINFINLYSKLMVFEKENGSRFEPPEEYSSREDNTTLTAYEDIPSSCYMLEFFMI
jgi:hypothetical protein